MRVIAMSRAVLAMRCVVSRRRSLRIAFLLDVGSRNCCAEAILAVRNRADAAGFR